MSLLTYLNITPTPDLVTSQTYLHFTEPDLDTVSLLHNSNFTDSLGCFIDNDQVSCDEICGNLTAVLLNWSNFYTCSWYPALSITVDNANVTTHEVEILENLGVFGARRELSSNVSATLAHCLADYCSSSAECSDLDISQSCTLNNLTSGGNGSEATLNQANTFECMRVGVCSSTTEVNPDIGGLGVVISLIIQYSISLLGLVIHALFCLRFNIAKRAVVRHAPPAHIDKRLQQAKKKHTQHLEALTSALVEFQKSQCFFASTLQVAALIVIPTYLSQVRGKDQILLNLAAANAFSPIMLTLAHIDLLGGRNSWYILFLSTITFALGSGTYWDASPTLFWGHTFEVELLYENPPAVLASCGNVAPFAPCFMRNEFFEHDLWPIIGGVWYKLPEKTGLTVWVVSLAMLVHKVVSKVLGIRKNKERTMRHVRDLWGSVRDAAGAVLRAVESFRLGGRILAVWRHFYVALGLKTTLRKLGSMLGKERSWDYASLGFGTAALIIQLGTVIAVLKHSSQIIATQMSFGQIVAVGIWIPVLLEYAYLEINGAREGTEYRLKHTLVVNEQIDASENVLPKTRLSTECVCSLSGNETVVASP